MGQANGRTGAPHPPFPSLLPCGRPPTYFVESCEQHDCLLDDIRAALQDQGLRPGRWAVSEWCEA